MLCKSMNLVDSIHKITFPKSKFLEICNQRIFSLSELRRSPFVDSVAVIQHEFITFRTPIKHQQPNVNVRHYNDEVGYLHMKRYIMCVYVLLLVLCFVSKIILYPVNSIDFVILCTVRLVAKQCQNI